MNYLHLINLRLPTRNEGKIKSYDSCTDIRAWSHDLGVQDRYLREWMKADMPICYIPCCSMTGCLSRMTCRSRRRATPHCHPDCKSKVLLDSICNSCQAVKECLQKDEGLEKYFVEEELESSQWPCDKCLEALKSIKMFWKILLDKIFGINLSKCDAFETNCECPDTVRSVARLWQSDILQQANFVQNAPLLYKSSDTCKRKTCSMPEWREPCYIGDNKCNSYPQTYVVKPYSCGKRTSRCTSTRIKKNDCGCNTSCDDLEEKICTYKNKITCLQTRCNVQNEDLRKLRKENCMLRKEIENISQGCPWKASFYLPNENVCRRSVTIIPKPFECHMDNNCCPVNNIDSEMIITMENGKNESFRYVSLLQVLHKTNDPIIKDTTMNCKSSCKKEDPIEILNKVHNTVGAIVKREMGIANDRKCQTKKTEVDATFHKLQCSKSAPSCSTISSQLSCETDYGCTNGKDSCQRACIRVTKI